MSCIFDKQTKLNLKQCAQLFTSEDADPETLLPPLSKPELDIIFGPFAQEFNQMCGVKFEAMELLLDSLRRRLVNTPQSAIVASVTEGLRALDIVRRQLTASMMSISQHASFDPIWTNERPSHERRPFIFIYGLLDSLVRAAGIRVGCYRALARTVIGQPPSLWWTPLAVKQDLWAVLYEIALGVEYLMVSSAWSQWPRNSELTAFAGPARRAIRLV